MSTETSNLSQNPAQFRAAVRERLISLGVMPTRQRLQIAQVILSRPQHLSAEQLLHQVNSNARGDAGGVSVSKATVYNTLSLFVAKGIVREVLVDSGRTFYDSNTSRHFHLYNEDDGTLTDVPNPRLIDDTLSQTLPDIPAGTELAGVDVIIRVRNSRNPG